MEARKRTIESVKGISDTKAAIAVDRMRSRVSIGSPNECWEWKGTVDDRGRPKRVYMRSHRWKPVRLMYTLTYGNIPTGKQLNHHCDNLLCCNPSHVYVGTHEQNMTDMVNRNRQATGERHGGHKLTVNDVRAIRHQYEPGFHGNTLELARQYNISKTQIYNIVSGKHWKGNHDTI